MSCKPALIASVPTAKTSRVDALLGAIVRGFVITLSTLPLASYASRSAA